MKNKLFTKEEREAIEKVLDMGFTIHNAKEDSLQSVFGDIRITNSSWEEKEYQSISTALTRFMQRESDYHNGL